MSRPDYGSVYGSVTLSGTIGAPILRTSAYAMPGKRVSTNSYALQSFTYTGSEVTTRTFAANVTYQIQPTPDVAALQEMGIYAGLTAFTVPIDTVDVGETPRQHFEDLQGGAFDGMNVLATAAYQDVFTHTVDVRFTVDDGDTQPRHDRMDTGPVADASSQRRLRRRNAHHGDSLGQPRELGASGHCSA